MQIHDEDMQMVRDFLATAGAPEYIKGHFENLVEQHAKEAGRAEDLQERVDELESVEADEIGKIQTELDELQDKYDDLASDGMRGALETVKYWLLDVLVHGRPMQKPPRTILRIVEDAL